MKKVYFYCTHCQAKKYIKVVDIQTFYIIGKCPDCLSKIVINRKRIEAAIAARK